MDLRDSVVTGASSLYVREVWVLLADGHYVPFSLWFGVKTKPVSLSPKYHLRNDSGDSVLTSRISPPATSSNQPHVTPV